MKVLGGQGSDERGDQAPLIFPTEGEENLKSESYAIVVSQTSSSPFSDRASIVERFLGQGGKSLCEHKEEVEKGMPFSLERVRVVMLMGNKEGFFIGGKGTSDGGGESRITYRGFQRGNYGLNHQSK